MEPTEDTVADSLRVLCRLRVGEGQQMKAIRSIVAVLALAVLALPHPAPASSTLAQLRGMQELKSWFNTFNGHPRLIFLVSPT